MKNLNPAPRKSSKVERLANKFVLLMLLLEISMVLICTIGVSVWTSVLGSDSEMWYLKFFYP
jgi:hypothetical protein